MELVSSDYKKSVNIGTSDTWVSLISTIDIRLDYYKEEISLAIEFLRSCTCSGENGYKIARQINLIRDELSKFKPDQIVYDASNLTKKAPWEGNISEVITSCANFYTTADGEDLLFELVKILCYAQIKKVNIQLP